MTKKNFFSPLVYYLFGISAIGIYFISISSLFEAQNSLGDTFFFLRKQLTWIILGIIMFFISSKINIKIFFRLAFPLYISAIIFLILVLIPGVSDQIFGARRWISLGIINFQPSEYFKLISLIFFSALFSNQKYRQLKYLLFFLLIPFFLIVLEPNLSTALLIIAMIVSLYYLSGASFIPLFFSTIFFIILGSALIFSSPYRLSRLKTVLNIETNKDLNYHSQQIIFSLASGGLTGKGIANSDQKYKFLPKISTDSLLAIIGEETGFIGLLLFTIFYTSFISYLFRLSRIIDDQFQQLLVVGFTCWISFQAIINFAATVALIPLTGIPFPFVSYGGSSLLSLFITAGIVRNIEKKYLHLLYSIKHGSKYSSHRHPSHSRS